MQPKMIIRLLEVSQYFQQWNYPKERAAEFGRGVKFVLTPLSFIQVSDLLGKFPDLMDEFNQFFERCESNDGFQHLAGVMSKMKNISMPVKGEEKETETEREHKRDLDAAKEKERSNDKYMGKSIQELDLSDCERCTPSYRLLPSDYPIPSVRHRQKLGAAVLNDHWVSVTSGSEDYSFKHMRRNQYEESCLDVKMTGTGLYVVVLPASCYRFELDMLLESVGSAAKSAEELLNNIVEKKISIEGSFRVEDHFTALNLRCIERLYGDHGLDVTDLIRKNPAAALPVILTRLKQKQEEWTKCREDFNAVWADVYAKNHYKSLDHRSFYLSSKILELECQSCWSQTTIIPHFEYEYLDRTIHEDLFKLVQFSCEEICSTKEQIGKGQGSNSVEDAVETKHHGALTSGDVNVSSDSTNLATKLAANGDEYASSGVSKHGAIGLLKRDSSAKENCKDGDPANKDVPPKDQENGNGADKRSGDSSHIPSGVENNNGKVGSGDSSGSRGILSKSGDAIENTDTIVIANGVLPDASKANSNYDEPGGPSNIEKEEGELSPIADSEDNFVLRVKEEQRDGFASYRRGQSVASIPLSKHVAAAALLDERQKDSRVFYGNDDFYASSSECNRPVRENLSAKTYCTGSELNRRNTKDTSSPDPYARFMSALFSLLNGSAESSKFEDECRAIYGNQSYVLFTLEKLIYKLVKQLQAVVADDMDNKLLQLYEYEKSRKPGRVIDSVYYENARILLTRKIFIGWNVRPHPSRLSIQLMDSIVEKPEAYAVSLDPTFSSYLQKEFLPTHQGKK
ncbi:LOW QUALITY PROTEIN: hypothetical protein HID58_013759 [Brassica napus]|uniref:Histone deacetylase interacting domain-containing protein n=1 Tax=Brassica napus TaxID=3708 RepID=A0ABQ7XJG3_BRANA|nr:LOW QUALITY PROTEIN: hypothetical protein HID58_013759 [Brassica napus]